VIAAVFVVSACASTETTLKTGLVAVRQVYEESDFIYMEGAVPEFSLRGPDGAELLRSPDGTEAWSRVVRAEVPVATYRLDSHVRACVGYCGELDPPTDACRSEVDVVADVVTDIVIHHTAGRSCTIELTNGAYASPPGGRDSPD
jgi:hypothetical protein